MKRPVVGVIGSMHLVENRFPAQRVGERNLRAVADVVGALPLMFAGSPEITDIDALLEVVDGVVLTGARANVHPTRFGVEPHASYEPYDEPRDELALKLVETCVERGVPLLGVCRGFQEMARRLRLDAASGNSRIARPHEPPHAAAAEWRDPSRPGGDLWRPPRRSPHARRRLRQDFRQRRRCG